jgi:hypothetical protein
VNALKLTTNAREWTRIRAEESRRVEAVRDCLKLTTNAREWTRIGAEESRRVEAVRDCFEINHEWTRIRLKSLTG